MLDKKAGLEKPRFFVFVCGLDSNGHGIALPVFCPDLN